MTQDVRMDTAPLAQRGLLVGSLRSTRALSRRRLSFASTWAQSLAWWLRPRDYAGPQPHEEKESLVVAAVAQWTGGRERTASTARYAKQRKWWHP